MPSTGPGIQSSVVVQGPDPFPIQKGCHLIYTFATHGVNDPSLAAVFSLYEIQDLTFRVVLCANAITNIRPVEAGDENPGPVQTELPDDIVSSDLVGGRRERHTRHGTEPIGQRGKLSVLRTEVVTPLTDTVRFIDRKKRDFLTIELIQETFGKKPFGRNVQKVELAPFDGPPGVGGFSSTEVGSVGDSTHTHLVQLRDLVLHERNQGRYHNAHARTAKGRHLITNRLAATGRHQDQCIAGIGNMPDDLCLEADEVRMAKYAGQRLARALKDGWVRQAFRRHCIRLFGLANRGPHSRQPKHRTLLTGFDQSRAAVEVWNGSVRF